MIEENDFGFIACTEEELKIAAKVAATNATTPAPAIVNVDLAPVNSALARIEQKMDKVLSMELTELSSAVSEQGSNFQTTLSEIEERIAAEKTTGREKLLKVEGLVIPLLNNLMKNMF